MEETMVEVDWNIVADVQDWNLERDSPTIYGQGTLRAPLKYSPFPPSTSDGRAVKSYMVLQHEPNPVPADATIKSIFISKITEITPGEGQFFPDFTGWTGEPVISIRELDGEGYIVSDTSFGSISIEDLVSGDEKHEGTDIDNGIAPGEGDDTVTAGAGDDTVGDTDG
jgi:hypothetical protein